jgi:putative Ca2+/H+ antiporter (TMEM165/GDT1 family)
MVTRRWRAGGGAGCNSGTRRVLSPATIEDNSARPAGNPHLMDWKVFATVFAAVFIAELGDKTQLATMLFAADGQVSRWTVFFAASAALVLASAIGVLAGSLLAEYINEKYLHYIAGAGFMIIGAITLYNA